MREHFEHSIENNRTVIYNSHRPDDACAVPAYWPADMGNAVTPPEKGQVLDPQPKTSQTQAEGLGKLFGIPPTHTEDPEVKKKGKKCHLTLKIVFLVLATINIVKSIALIAVSVTTAIAIKIFTDEQSGRRVAMIIIAITAAITLSISIYSIVAVMTNKTHRLMLASGVLLILAIIQAVLLGIATQLNDEDEVNLSRALSDSFALARGDSPRHVKLWNNIQHDLTCCGVYGPDDYRSLNVPDFFSPDVPISCCPTYDPDRSSLVQERERESCKAKKEYYDVGCRESVIQLYRDTAQTVLGVTIGLIIFMVALAVIGVVMAKKCKPQADSPPPPPQAPQNKASPKPLKV
ncbi:uncharacterized protein LOC123880895 [Maniola jurtina]|uniref:uncharacterized protein LOC123880895 n=1 Tax=Maniola jurtina TaxID=191418 RepID=UPI001E686951|nr:uncharacterized protein LOC123880895 [Maniola jurtina]